MSTLILIEQLLLPLLKRIWPLLVAAIVSALATSWFVHTVDRSAYQSLQVANEQQAVIAQASATVALQKELQAAQDTSARNAAIIEGLNHANADLAADRDTARRLLALAQAPATPAARPTLPQGAGKPGIARAGPAPGVGALTDAVAAAIAECRRNSEQLDALIAEVKPQT